MIHVSLLRFHRRRGAERSEPICEGNGQLRDATAQFELLNAVILLGLGGVRLGLGGLRLGLGSGVLVLGLFLSWKTLASVAGRDIRWVERSRSLPEAPPTHGGFGIRGNRWNNVDVATLEIHLRRESRGKDGTMRKSFQRKWSQSV